MNNKYKERNYISRERLREKCRGEYLNLGDRKNKSLEKVA
jgi:hypothetical protein